MNEAEARAAIIETCLRMNASGLNQGTSGNVSARVGGVLLITPSAVPYDQMTPDLIAAMPMDGAGEWHGPKKPSSEWRFHLDIARARPEVGAIVHAHPTYCTALAMCRRDIPAAHYMIAAFGGTPVRCGGYAAFGSAELSRLAVEALHDRWACLLANHGMIAMGETLERAYWRAEELETLARQYVHALSIGGPVLLSDDQIAEAIELFKDYRPSE